MASLFTFLKDYINIYKNRYNFLASFFTLFINCNPRSSAPMNRRFPVRFIRFLAHVHSSYYIMYMPSLTKRVHFLARKTSNQAKRAEARTKVEASIYLFNMFNAEQGFFSISYFKKWNRIFLLESSQAIIHVLLLQFSVRGLFIIKRHLPPPPPLAYQIVSTLYPDRESLGSQPMHPISRHRMDCHCTCRSEPVAVRWVALKITCPRDPQNAGQSLLVSVGIWSLTGTIRRPSAIIKCRLVTSLIFFWCM